MEAIDDAALAAKSKEELIALVKELRIQAGSDRSRHKRKREDSEDGNAKEVQDDAGRRLTV